MHRMKQCCIAYDHKIRLFQRKGFERQKDHIVSQYEARQKQIEFEHKGNDKYRLLDRFETQFLYEMLKYR